MVYLYKLLCPTYRALLVESWSHKDEDLLHFVIVQNIRCKFICLQETIRVIFDIWDVDFDPVENTHPTIPIAQNVYFDIVQPGSTSVVWSSIQSTRASNLPDLTIRYQYRLICIPGFCGVYCTTEALFCPVILAACNCQSNSDCSDATCQVCTYV